MKALEAFEDQLADGLVGLDGGVGFAEILGVDAAGGGADGGADEPFIDKSRYLFEDAMLLDHVGGLEGGAGEHQLPVQGCGFGFQFADIDEVGIVDESEGSLGRDDLYDFVEMFIGVSEADDVFDILEAE